MTLEVRAADARTADAARRAHASARFGEALRAARGRDSGSSATRSGSAAVPAPKTTERRADADRRERAQAEEAHGPAPCGAAPARRDGDASPAEVQALRAVVRALPPDIAAVCARDGALTLALGSLGVDLRSGPHGVEIALRPPPRLARVAAVELPGLVAALRARGITVARAEVRGASPRASARSSGREPCVDGGPGVR
jgi:hypothetical protein